MAPVRVQLSRKKGWRMPPNTVKVDRSTKWGNPFRPGEYGPMGRKPIDLKGAVGFFRDMIKDKELRTAAAYPEDLLPLRGKNLACWCGPGRPCHADVLLEIANASFVDRAPGDDTVQDIIDAAEYLRRAHPSYRDAKPLMAMNGDVRCFWALMLEATRIAAGLSLDELIERIREQARARREG